MLLAMLCVVYVINSAAGKRPVLLSFCEKGPLASVDACSVEGNLADVTTSGWGYSNAHGAISSAMCDLLSLNPAEISIPLTHQQPERLLKTDCSLLRVDNNHFCYASQRMAADGNTRFTNIFTTDANCGDARFFRGSKAKPAGGRGQRTVDWKTPYPGIPEIKN